MPPKSQGLMAQGVHVSGGASTPTPQRERASSVSKASGSRAPKAAGKAATAATPSRPSLRAAGEAVLKKLPKSSAPRPKAKVSASEAVDPLAIAAAIKIQALFRGHWHRMYARRMRQRKNQLEEERRYQEEEKQRAEAAKRAREEAAAEKKHREAAKREAEAAKRDQALRALRDRKSTIEIMCQTLPKQEEPWEEDAELLVRMLDNVDSFDPEQVLGRHQSKRTARKRYLALARRWHPDKWGQQGDLQIEIATEVTKLLTKAYQHLGAKLPAEVSMAKEDDDDDTEANEFAAFFGINFAGMAEIYNRYHKGVKNK